jgi:hypothetical protein
MKLIFVIGPYRSNSPWQKEHNIRMAEEVGMRLTVKGYFPVIPQANTRPYFEGLQPDEFWLEGTTELLKRCDGYALAPGWSLSKGSVAELEIAQRLELQEVTP